MAQKVLMFGWEFPPYNSGGLGVACLGLTKSLVNSGVDVSFVLPYKFNLSYDYMKFIYANKTEIDLESYNRYKELFNPYQILHKINYNPDFNENLELEFLNKDIYHQVINYASQVPKIIYKKDFDIIHCHDWLTIPAGLIAKEITNKPLIVHIHATEMDRTGGHPDQNIYEIERLGMQTADKVIAVSKFTKEIITKDYNIDPVKIEIVHNGIDYYNEKSSDKDEELIQNIQTLKNIGKKIVIFSGRLTMQKGIEYFLQAAKIASQYNPNLLFLVVGSGDIENRLINLTANLGLSNKVIFTGFVRERKLKSIYHIADLLVMPSIAEPFGLVALEAISHETPVILSKNSGVREVVSHSLQVDFWDTHMIAEMILAVFCYPTLEFQLREYSHQEVKNITWESAAQKCKNLYQNY